MNIYGSLMIIFDQKKKSFMTRKIFVSLMTIFDQKTSIRSVRSLILLHTETRHVNLR